MANRARLVPGYTQVLGRTKVAARKRCRPGGQSPRSLPSLREMLMDPDDLPLTTATIL